MAKNLNLKEKEVVKTGIKHFNKLLEKMQGFNTYEEFKIYFKSFEKKEPKWFENFSDLLDKMTEYESTD